jgi:hypothetical protein
MPTYTALGLLQVGFFVKECPEGEKGESRPMKDRLCPGTTPYSQSIQVPRCQRRTLSATRRAHFAPSSGLRPFVIIPQFALRVNTIG